VDVAGIGKWKLLFATALYTGMWKSEPFALQKADVDLPLA
jgi:hypothetical protein